MYDHSEVAQEAQEIVEELRGNDDVLEVWVGDIDVGYAEVYIRYSGFELPAGFLTFIGERADLEVEGRETDSPRGNELHLTAYV